MLSGVILIHGINPITVIKETSTNYLWGNFSNQFSILIVLFVFALIGMVSIINRGGGTLGVVNLFSKAVRGARSAGLATMAMGFSIFFDDYANTIVVGSTMRSLTDKMRISREKLAYIVDSTTAPIAGLALISTWIGFEVEQLRHVTENLKLSMSGYELFLHMLPYRYYCIFTLVLVFFITFLRRDFGPMLKAERRARFMGLLTNPDSDEVTSQEFTENHVKPNIPHRWYNAVIPVTSVVLSCLIGLVLVGTQSPNMVGKVFCITSWDSWYTCFTGVGLVDNGIPMILAGSAIAGSIIAALLMLAQGILTIKDIAKAWFHGWRIIFVIAALLIFTWALRQVCDELGTAYFILAAASDLIGTFWLPLTIFIISSMIAFATGTSWGTMGILFPIFAPVAGITGDISILVISMSAILDGAIFGDHCSPISDTTVLSSISSSCGLMDHVRTQMPYALTIAVVAAIAGYIPAALGLPVLSTYALGLGIIIAIMFTIAKRINPPGFTYQPPEDLAHLADGE